MKQVERQGLLALTNTEKQRERLFLRFARRSLAMAKQKGLTLSVFDLLAQAHNMARTGHDWCVMEENVESFESTWHGEMEEE